MMNPNSISCDPRLLQRSLEDNLSVVEEESLAAHLGRCDACRRSLEHLAAQQPLWHRIGEVLRDESSTTRHAILCDAASSPTDETILFEHREGYDAFPADFAVDFLDPATSDESMGRIGDIEILHVVGNGGMGIVLKGHQPALNRPVAVKVLAPHLATSGAARQRFAREARAAAAVVHPNVMPIFTVDASGKLPYLVMPYIDGESLQERIDRHGPLPTVDVLRIGLHVARGLAAAHAQGLVHRDVKPANMLLERGVDRVLLTDFGLARAADDASLTRTGFIAGTPQYMSPEQARGDSIDARSDLFSLGSVMYAMCTGRPPFRADSSYGILRRITDNDPRPITDCQPSTPRWLSRLIDKLLEKQVDDRFQSADTAAEIIEQCLAHLQQPNHVDVPESLQSRRRHKPSLAIVSIVTCVTLALAAIGMWIWHTQHRPPNAATVNPIRAKRPAESTTNQVATSLQNTDPAPSLPLPVPWEDNAATEIQQLRNGVQDLQKHVDDMWENP